MTKDVYVKRYNRIKGGVYLMEDINNKNKIIRVLDIYTKLIQGEVVNKVEQARNYNVNERSIQRDIEDIRNYMDKQMESTGIINSVVYDRKLNGYKLEQEYTTKLSNSEALAICKILLDSRAFTKDEMQNMLKK